MNDHFHALLIGVDFYLPGVSDAGAYYPSLNGCVSDVGLVEEVLRTRFQVPAGNVLKLTATNRQPQMPPEASEQLPTYANMVNAFRTVIDRADPGDQVYLHYSGHGGRVRTRFEDLKGKNAYDETLVPTDIGHAEARHLRDLELAHLLKTMVDKGLVVTVVLDSCHSGGATRGKVAGAVRGVEAPDLTERSTESLVASDEELRATWKSVSRGGATRDVSSGSGWLPEPEGYLLLSACRASELANETVFGDSRHGALTYWLTDSLKRIGPGTSYRHLHNRILGKVHSAFQSQTPQLQGDGSRVVFGLESALPQFAVNVMDTDDAKGTVRLQTGQAQGVRKGARFVVYPPEGDVTDPSLRLAVVEVREMGAAESRATVLERLTDRPLDAGAQAVLEDPGRTTLVRGVCLAQRDDLPRTVDQTAALAAAEAEIRKAGEGFVALREEGEDIDFQIAVSEEGVYEIWNVSGEAIANLRPPLPVDEENAASRLVKRIVHLARYRNVRDLANEDPVSPLAGKLEVELTGVQREFEPGDRPNPEPFKDPGHTPELRVGEWTFLRIKNRSSRPLNVAALDLTSSWKILQFYPRPSVSAFEHFDPGQEITIPLRADLAEGYDRGVDVIKVFATVGPANYRWLELPALDQPRTRSGDFPAPANPLEELLAAAAARTPRTREVSYAANPSEEWTTEQVELHIRRSDG